MVSDNPVLILTFELFHLIFSPCPTERGWPGVCVGGEVAGLREQLGGDLEAR